MAYSLIKKIGGGNYGEIFSGTLEIAIKRISKSLVKKQDLYQEIERERQILTQCESKNIVKLYDFIENENYYDFILEKCDSDLSQILHNRRKGFSLLEIKNIMKQLNNAFKTMQKNNIIHRDIKLENILIKYINKSKNEFNVKLCDFGLSREIKTNINDSFAGSFETMAPEILNENPYNNKVDLWSIGIIMYQMYFNKFPTFDNNDFIVDLPDEDIYFKNLLEKLLKKNPNERINWNEYFNHPFFLDSKHINIIVLGKKNVGKSTLIKNILNDKGEKKNNNNYSVNNINFINKNIINYPIAFSNCMIYENKKDNKFRFYEMKGYNERRYTFENVLKDINNLIQNQLLKKDTDKFINFIWYCFQKEKYNEEEQKNIEELKNNFNDEKQIKIFFISTKTKDKLSINEIFKKISNFKNNNSRKKLIEEEEKYIKFKVLAEPMEIINEKGKLIDIINPFGIDSLIKNTIEKFNDNNKEKKSDFISLYSQRNKRPLYLIKTIKNFS